MNYLADDGTYKRLGSVNLYTSMEGLPQQLAVLMDDNLVEINRFNEAKQYLQELNDNVYLILTDIYNEADGSRTIESNQLYTFLYDSVSDSIYIIGSINPLNQLYDGNNPLSSTKEVTQITNTAKIIRKTINSGIYANVNGFIVRVEDNQFDSVDNPLGTATTRSINFLTEGNGKDVLFNDGTYKNLQDSIDFSNFLGKDNTVPYTPTQPYHPATKKYVDDVAATKADLSDVGNVADLTTDNKTVVGAINEHETQINQHTYYINNINLTIQDIQEEIEGIHGDISEINTEISGIHSDISNINTEIDDIQQDIVTINGNIVSINNTLTQHQNTLNSHQTTLNQHQTSIDNLNSSVSTINSNITDIRGDITDINNSITDLTEWVQDFEIPIATSSVLGGVKIGSGVNVTADGTISVDEVNWSNIEGKPSTFPTDWGSISGKPSSFYTLPIATDTVLGGVKSTKGSTNYVESASRTAKPYGAEGSWGDGSTGFFGTYYDQNRAHATCIYTLESDTSGFTVPAYMKEGFVTTTEDDNYATNMSTRIVYPEIEGNDSLIDVKRSFQVSKDVSFYTLSRHIANKILRPGTKIILKLYNNIIDGTEPQVSQGYKDYVFLRFQLWTSSSSTSSDEDMSYYLKPSSISFINEDNSGYYNCEFDISEDCANYVNQYYLGNIILQFFEIVDVTLRDTFIGGDYDFYSEVTHRTGIYGCSLNKYFEQYDDGIKHKYVDNGVFPINMNELDSDGTPKYRSFYQLLFWRKDAITGTGQHYENLRNVAWEVIAPEGTETTDYYVEVEDDGKMKVAIPSVASNTNYYECYSTNENYGQDFNNSQWSIQSGVVNWIFNLTLPDSIDNVYIDAIFLRLAVSKANEASEGSITGTYDVEVHADASQAINVYHYTKEAGISIGDNTFNYIGYDNASLYNVNGILSANESTLSGNIDIRVFRVYNNSLVTDSMEQLRSPRVYIRYHKK